MQQTMDSLIKGREPVLPKFIITYGPPGSGKSSMLNHAVYNNKVDVKNTVEVNVDSIISNFDPYKEDLERVRELMVTNPREARDLAIQIYWKYRQAGNSMSDFILNTALLNRYNVIWETTGNSIQWTIREIERIRRYGYKILLVYPFVDIEELQRRVSERSKRELRFVDPEYIQRVNIAAQRNFMELAKYVDEAYLYNNDVPEPNWEAVVYFTNSILNPQKKCNIPELEDLLPKMTNVLGEALIEKCS